MQPDAVAHIRRLVPQLLQAPGRLLDRRPLLRVFDQAHPQDVYELGRILAAEGGQVEVDAAHFEAGLGLVVIELGLVQSQQLQHYHGDCEQVSFVDVNAGLILQLSDVGQLLGGQDEVVNERLIREGLIVGDVLVLALHVEQEHLDVALGAEEDAVGAVLAERDAVGLEVGGEVEEAPHDVGEFGFVETAVAHFFLFDGLLDGEIVVVTVSVDLRVLYAHVVF